MNIYIGADPGKSGAIAAVFENGEPYGDIRMKETESDISEWVSGVAKIVMHEGGFAVVEKVSSSPQMGVKSAFTFGENYGFQQGLFVAHSIPWEHSSPQRWQKAMSCMTKGDKNVTKTVAQRLFPYTKIIHANADAYLIAEYSRRLCASRRPAKNTPNPE